MRKILIVLGLISLIISGCSTVYTNRNPEGEIFPTVSGESLEKKEVLLPGYFKNSNVILLLGFKQDSQFDIDRWLIGLDMTKTDSKVNEIPTIQGLFPRMFSTRINEGMRSGIPKELWGGVITVYKDGAELQKFSGNENGNNARVMLLDENARVVYFYDRGFSVQALNALRDKLNSIAE